MKTVALKDFVWDIDEKTLAEFEHTLEHWTIAWGSGINIEQRGWAKRRVETTQAAGRDLRDARAAGRRVCAT